MVGGAAQAGPVEPVGEPPQCGFFEGVLQRPVAQARVRAEQVLDDGQRAVDVAVVQSFSDVCEGVRPAMGAVDELEAGQRGAGQFGQRLLPPDLVGCVVQRDQDAVDAGDAVWDPLTQDAVGTRGVRWGRRLGGDGVAGCQGGGHQWMQPSGVDRAGPEQGEVGKDVGRRVRQEGRRPEGGRFGGHRDRTASVAGHVQHQPAPGVQPHGDGPSRASPSRVTEQDAGLVRPAVHGVVVARRQQPGRHHGLRPGRNRPGPVRQFGRPAGVPQVPVQVEPEPPAGPGARMPAGPLPQPVAVPQREAHALAARRPRGRGPSGSSTV
ncbi:hypothetical protein STREPTOSP366_62510 [Streptomyces variabilis]